MVGAHTQSPAIGYIVGNLDLLLSLDELHKTVVMEGWDFSRLHGRIESEDVPWDFDDDCLRALQTLSRGNTPPRYAVDLGTGGGERLAGLVDKLADSERIALALCATEGWEPNVRVARTHLRSYGIPVRYYDAETRDALPFSNDSLGLVMARHEAIDAYEVSRALASGGAVLTQQVAGNDTPEFHEWFGTEPAYPDVTLAQFLDEFNSFGLIVEVAEEWEGRMRFSNVHALVEYIALVPWSAPGFIVSDHAETLERLDASGPIDVTQRRFRVYARKP